MRALQVEKCAPIESSPLRLVDISVPEPAPGEILVKISVCGACRTDLHVIEGDLPQAKLPIIPGHQVVGTVVRTGSACHLLKCGDRVGIAWLGSTCGRCEFCRRAAENLCPRSTYTGCHTNGGYAEYLTAREEYAYLLPEDLADEEAAPLLCAGIIGYRALKRSALPDGGKLGIFGFGSSAHITMQAALGRGAEVFVATRGAKHQELAREMGAAWAGDADKPLPEQVDSVIVFAPAGELVPLAMRSLKPGGTTALAGIHMSPIPQMEYERCLFHERNLCSVEANTRADGRELFAEAIKVGIRPRVSVFPLLSANEVLAQLKSDGIQGTAVFSI